MRVRDQGFSLGRVSFKKKEAAIPTKNVPEVPIRTYHVNAIGVRNLTYSISAKPAIMPQMAAFWPTRRVNTPSKNTPSSDPYRTEAIDNPACKTLPQLRESKATPNRIIPQATVASRALATQRDSSRSLLTSFASGRRKSITVVEASEFNAAERFDMAAARIAAITSPAAPV